MKVIETSLPGCVVLEPAVFGDARGVFFEAWNADRFGEHGLPVKFVQSNVSTSVKGVLRGLHYQWPRPQGKLFGGFFTAHVQHLLRLLQTCQRLQQQGGFPDAGISTNQCKLPRHDATTEHPVKLTHMR